jgi:hypothetical protein
MLCYVGNKSHFDEPNIWTQKICFFVDQNDVFEQL